ncbi:MAG: S1 family peptidase [Bifidobacteriaceae bacterium]|jgi:streptogrisin C|nr:S1 family peptidase [Bifidobacteriaceae bacterium]
MSKRRLLMVTVAAMSAVALVTVVPTAEGASASDLGTGGTLAAPPDHAIVAAYAESAGVSRATAWVRMTQEEAIAEALVGSGLESSNDRADVWLSEDQDGLTLHIRSIEPDAISILRSAGRAAGLPVITESRPAVVADRTDIAASKAARLTATIPGLAGFYIDTETGKLVVDVSDPERSSETRVEAALDPAALAEEITGLAAVVNRVGSPAGDTATVNGAVALANCTAGFTGTYKSGSTTYQGFFTAAHCGTTVSYFYNTGGTGTSKAATYKTRKWNASGDIAFHAVASGDSTTNKFFGSSATSATTQSSDVHSAATGATVCRRGKTNGYTCGKVQTLGYTPTWSNACNGVACGAAFVKTNQTTKGGDSGAPVWAGTGNPVGIHKGGSEGGLFGIGQFSVYSTMGQRPAGTELK